MRESTLVQLGSCLQKCLTYSLKSLSSIVFLTYPPFAPFLYRVRPTHVFAYQLHIKIVNALLGKTDKLLDSLCGMDSST